MDNENPNMDPVQSSPEPTTPPAGEMIQPAIQPAQLGTKRTVVIAGIIIATAVVVLLAGAAFAYSKGYNLTSSGIVSPAGLWEKFFTNNSEQIMHADYSLAYSDPETYDGGDSEFSVKTVALKVEGSGYFNSTDPKNPEFDANLKYTASSAKTTISSAFDVRGKDQALYVKIGDIPLISNFFTNDAGKKVDWLKLDTKSATEGSEESDTLKQLYDPTFQDKLKKIWLDNKIITLDTFVGRETISGASTMHFKGSVNKEGIKKAVSETIDALSALGTDDATLTDEDRQLAEYTIEKLTEKIQVQSLDLWIGVSDANLYKMHIATNAPSVASVLKAYTDAEAADSSSSSMNYIFDEVAEPKSLDQKKKEISDIINKINFDATLTMDTTYRDYGKKQTVEVPSDAYDIFKEQTAQYGTANDAKRMADIRQLGSAFELFYNDNGEYPNSLEQLVPTYLSVLPTAPTPASGTCTEQQNTYTYKRFAAEDYSLTFCLSTTVNGTEPGFRTLSPQGIQ